MTLISFLVTVIINCAFFFVGFKIGIKTEQRDRKRRISYLKKLLNGNL